MFYRSDYMQGKVSHEEFYSQFVTDWVKDRVIEAFTIDRLIEAYREDQSFNTIDNSEWDRLGLPLTVINQVKIANRSGGYSLSDQVCILKCTAELVVKENC